MWYFVLYGILAVWVFVDSKNRKGSPIVPAVLTFFIGPVNLPFYLATRNLKESEVREGGRGWNIMKNFVIFWTLMCVVWVIAGAAMVGSQIQASQNEYEQAGSAIGGAIGMGLIFGLWLMVALVALVIGLLLKKSSIVEKGPTGALAATAAEA